MNRRLALRQRVDRIEVAILMQDVLLWRFPPDTETPLHLLADAVRWQAERAQALHDEAMSPPRGATQ